MFRLFSSHLGTAALAMAATILSLSSAQTAFGQPGSQANEGPTVENPASGSQYSGPGGGQERRTEGSGSQTTQSSGDRYGSINQAGTAATVVCPGGCYGGFHPFTCRAYAGAGYYGFFHRYYGYPFYGPSYRSGPMSPDFGYGLEHGLVFRSGGYGCAVSPAGMNPPSASASSAPPSNPARSANSAYLQFIVPENAEVLVEGSKTTRTGTLREFVSPSLDPEKSFTYTIAVRATDANGQTIEDHRSIRVRANDRLRIDFTRQTPPEQLTLSHAPTQ